MGLFSKVARGFESSLDTNIDKTANLKKYQKFCKSMLDIHSLRTTSMNKGIPATFIGKVLIICQKLVVFLAIPNAFKNLV